MILSEWRKAAPNRECMNKDVTAVLKPVLAGLGAADDPEVWVLWGEDPEFRYSVMAATPAGMITVAVRIIAGEGPRATGKLIRWSKLQVSELALEASGGHRVVAVQVEGQVLKGLDDEADRICEFVRGLLAGIDGRLYQTPDTAVLQAVQQVVATAPAARVPVAARPASKPALKSVPATTASVLGLDDEDGEASAAAKPAAKKPAAKGPAPKSQEAWVAPHPILLPAARAIPANVPVRPAGKTPAIKSPVAPAVPPADKPAAVPAAKPAAAPAAAAHKAPHSQPGQTGSVWEVPAPSESLVRETKRPRTWTP